MLGIFNRAMKTATRTDGWSAPNHWKHKLHKSTYDRQQDKAEIYRRRLAEDVTLWR